MPALRWHRSSLATPPPPPASVKLRWHRSAMVGSVPVAPKLRWHRSSLAGAIAVQLRALMPVVAASGQTVILTAETVDGATPDEFAWRRISGAQVTLNGAGNIINLVAPASLTGTAVTVGVRARIGTTWSAEQTVTVTALPHADWYRDGSTWKPLIGAPAASAGRALKIALIGDSTLWQDGAGEARLRALLTASGFQTARVFYYARIGKAIAYADDQGFTTLQNMAQARAAIGEPDIWLFNLGSNGHRDGDAKNVGWINTVLAAAGSGRVIWSGISQVTGYNAGASTEATRLHWNDIAKPLLLAASKEWADWHAYVKAYAGGDSTFWATDGVHMTTAGYTVKNAFLTAAVGAGVLV